MRNYQVTPEQIITEIYNIFSDEHRSRQYYNTMSAQYIGLCGWAGPMSPENRAAFIDAFGLETIETAEKVARARVAAYRAAYEASHYHRHEIEANEADPDQVPAAGSFVWCFGDGLKCEGGPMDPLKNHCEEWSDFRPELVEIAAVVTVPAADLLTADTAHRIAREYTGHQGGRYEEADPLRLDGSPYAWTVGVLVTDGARWYVVDSEGYDYARYILQPLTMADMYAPEIATIRQEIARREAEEAARVQAAADERRRVYLERCARWEGAGLVDVRPLDEAAAEANRLHGWRSKEAKSAQRKADAARRRNILTMCQAAAPGVKFSVRKWDGWGGSYCVSWTDGPTADSLKAAADLDLLEEGRDTFDGMTDCAGHEAAEFVEFSKKYLGVFGEIRTDRHESQEFRDEIAARIREAVPGLPASDQAQINEAQALEVAEAADNISGDRARRSHVVDMAERWGLRDVVAYVARITDRPTTTEAPDPSDPTKGRTGATYGDSEKSQTQELPAPPAAVVYDPAQPVERAEFHTVEEADGYHAATATGVAYGPAEKSQTRTPEAEAINAALVVVPSNVMRDFGFIADNGETVTNTGTACLLHPSLGFVVMPDDNGTPYSPLGGERALREILEAGGFLSFEGFRFVWPIDHNADSVARVCAAYGVLQKSQPQSAQDAADELEADELAETIAEHVRLKQKHPDALMLFRCGDFYELWFDDATAAADTLGLTLTRHHAGYNLCGFPYMALDTYLPRLVRAGHRVAICDDPRPRRTKRQPITA